MRGREKSEKSVSEGYFLPRTLLSFHAFFELIESRLMSEIRKNIIYK